jgi:hypothetical protein
MLVESISNKLGQPILQVRTDIDIEAKRLHSSKLDVARRVNRDLVIPKKPAEKPAEKPVEKLAATPAPPAPAKPIVPLNRMADDEIDALLQAESTAIVDASPMTEATIINIDNAKAQRDLIESLKASLLRPADVMTIGKNTFIKKSGVCQYAAFFNVSDEMVSKEVAKDEKRILWIFAWKAHLPNGRSTVAIGACANNERAGMREADVIATAQTRARSRAILALVAAGQVSADEIGE